MSPAKTGLQLSKRNLNFVSSSNEPPATTPRRDLSPRRSRHAPECLRLVKLFEVSRQSELINSSLEPSPAGADWRRPEHCPDRSPGGKKCRQAGRPATCWRAPRGSTAQWSIRRSSISLGRSEAPVGASRSLSDCDQLEPLPSARYALEPSRAMNIRRNRQLLMLNDRQVSPSRGAGPSDRRGTKQVARMALERVEFMILVAQKVNFPPGHLLLGLGAARYWG